MKTLHEMIKDLTGIDVEQDKISDYLEEEVLYLHGAYLRYANLSCANLKGIKITKKQLDQLTVIEENE
ncbi:hypothetical protein C6B38_09260 [Spiroplasma sp. ChiS]|uniref:pentapeptide repeat-containing protein n=1 Tax=Spiroplasma sp. ChiS TaxID=2099885 RepID=UPI000CF9DF7C|nr:pentapeptide repeat-containing protein [Spiroplasma sp. ChiS]PQP77936.1 hypothetical protein C6B38_09260 [Spiroplasma sp. ChiS]